MAENLKELRQKYQPPLPQAFKNYNDLVPEFEEGLAIEPSVASLLPHLKGPSKVKFQSGKNSSHQPKKVGVLFSGGQAAGGHNVVTGLFDALKKLNPESRLIGFKDGPKGLIENRSIELTAALLAPYRNQGGFDLLGSGRTKIETPEQFEASFKVAKELELDGLVIIGGDDSNTNAALLAEYFISHNSPISVIGVPKTIDGDLKSDEVEISFGFDSASKTYSEIIGNILRDSLSAKKYYFFIKLMGRSASHIALECALQTCPNVTLIGEEIAEHQKTLSQIKNDICDVICQRANQKKNFGVVLIPEGIIEFIPEFKTLISELNQLLANTQDTIKPETINRSLSEASKQCFQQLPKEIQRQLLLDRDGHGNVQVSKIETERLFIAVVSEELEKRKQNGTYSGSFSPQPLFLGYEGRSCYPSNFDANYCYALGHTAALLIDAKLTGYICTVKKLSRPVEEWEPGACYLSTMLTIEKRQGKEKPVIKKALVDLQGKPFKKFSENREKWLLSDSYCYPGPIQFFGPEELTDAITHTLKLESLK